ncbi:MAG: DEAD/DEAH box helicase family protein [Acholeplasma sp.]|nr:DEAD/DEAH box helicase family protein [Acholeplasma sp.]
MHHSIQYFKGQFRTYQKRVLDNASSYLDDGKIHIVAAPGSGKTILGLELISRLQEKAVIFSPSITIRQQWLDRYKTHFMQDSTQEDIYLSSSLLNLKHITSVTYQGLHAAMNKLIDKEVDELSDTPEIIDYTSFDLIKSCILAGIKTICLDEAHHLRNEWHKSLEHFIKALGYNIKVIALTATPPYDSNGTEWEKYISLCGEIDEEIFIPELVSQKTLAPHQDFIYFNYPTSSETKMIQDFREKAFQTLHVILEQQEFKSILANIFKHYENDLDVILERPNDHISLWVLSDKAGIPISRKFIKDVTLKKNLPSFDMIHAERAFNFIFEHEDLFPNIDAYKKMLHQANLMERGKVCFRYTSKLIKTLVTSTAKLNSMVEILKTEYEVLGVNLRLLVLTDFIKKENIKDIETTNELTTIGATTIFEAFRRALGDKIHLCILTGTLVVLPIALDEQLSKRCLLYDLNYTKTTLSSHYMILTFKGSNKHKVSMITSLFEDGLIKVIIGTASLLGEGWDSPSINSLILASYVGSFMLSNQMRGRAIRINPKQNNKVSHIWHLVSIEPKLSDQQVLAHNDLKIQETSSTKEIISADYETLKKRFECFMGPAYSKSVIESGIDRIDIIKPPFNDKAFDDINRQMISKAKDRDSTRFSWDDAIIHDEDYQVLERVQISEFKLPKSMSFYHYARELLIIVIITIFARIAPSNIQINSLTDFIIFASFPILSILFLQGFLMLLKHISPVKYVGAIAKALRDTLADLDLIESKLSKVRVNHDEYHIHINIELVNATLHDQHLFTSQMKELLSPIDNPRYVIIKKNLLGYQYKQSFSSPSLINKQEYASVFSRNLKKRLNLYDHIYTRDIPGRKHLLKCKRYSFINRNDQAIKRSNVYSKH